MDITDLKVFIAAHLANLSYDIDMSLSWNIHSFCVAKY